MAPPNAIQALTGQRLLLQMEYQNEKDTYRRQTEERGLERLVKSGDAWWPIRIGRSYYNSINQLCIEVFRNADDDTDHNFEPGRPVVFFKRTAFVVSYVRPELASKAGRTEPPSRMKAVHQGETVNPISYYAYTGTVSFVEKTRTGDGTSGTGDRMVVSIPDGTPLTELSTVNSSTRQPTTVGVQLSFDETSYRTMFEALDRVMRANGRLGYLRDLFYSSQKAETFTFQPMSFPYLNKTQQEAVNKVLRAKDVAIVHGPPGTGKTTTLVEAIHETLRRETQVLVCAQSNMAVDWISEKLIDRGIPVLRIGNPMRVDDKMLSFTYERRFEDHPDYPTLWAIRKAIRELRANHKRGDEKYHQKMDRLKDRATELEIRINAELFDAARVIACTLVGSAHRLLDGHRFGTVFIDEAAQALEAATWIPIRRCSRVILAGDHCQLPPTVKSFGALKGGLGKTLMERIVENKPEAVTLLRMQYRMNEEIMRFSSDWFYGGNVEAAPEVKYRSILDLDVPIEWIDTGNVKSEEASNDITYGESMRNSSRLNETEAELTLQVLQNYFERIGKTRILNERLDVGIISPYRAQVQLLRRLVKKHEYFKPFRSLISVNTVDGFQGQERDIIVISLVRSNDEGQIGFLRDLRRMNVAITRARMKLLIIGDASTLTRHPFYRKLHQYVKEELA